MTNKKFLPITFYFLKMWCVALVYFPSVDAASAVPTIHKSHLTRDWSGAYNVFFDNDDIENGSWIEDDKDSKPGAFKVQQWYPEGAELLKPRLKTFPEKYVYDGHAYFELLCEADLKKGDKLIWYQVFLNNEGVLRGRKIILYNEKEDHPVNKTLIINMLVVPQLQNSNYYCYRERTVSDEEIEYTYSNNITIVFPENDQLLIPSIPSITNFYLVTTASDNYDIYYNDTTPILVNCFPGHAAKWQHEDVGHFITWYQVHGSNKKKILKRIWKSFIVGYLRLELTKVWKASDNGSELFCERIFKLKNETVARIERTESYRLIYRLDECWAWEGWMWAAVAMVIAYVPEVAAIAIAATYCYYVRQHSSN